MDIILWLLILLPVVVIPLVFVPRRIQPTPESLASFRETENKTDGSSLLSVKSGKWSIAIDTKAEVVTFRFCHRRRTFWTLRNSPEFSCPLSDVLSVSEYIVEHSNLIEISTLHGKAAVVKPKSGPEMVSFEKVVSMLAAHAIDKSNSNFTQSTGFVYLVAFSASAILISLKILFIG